MCQYTQVFPRGRDSKHNYGHRPPDFPAAIRLELEGHKQSKSSSLRCIRPWWLVSPASPAPLQPPNLDSITIVSILRMVALIQSSGEKDFACKSSAQYSCSNSPLQGALIPVNLWTELEVNLAVVLVNLPSMLPLLRLAMGKKATSTAAASAGTWQSSKSHNRFVPRSKADGDFDRLNDSPSAPATASQSSYGKGYRADEWEMR